MNKLRFGCLGLVVAIAVSLLSLETAHAKYRTLVCGAGFQKVKTFPPDAIKCRYRQAGLDSKSIAKG